MPADQPQDRLQAQRKAHKLILAGDSGAGKSCLLARFVHQRFSYAKDSTIGVDYASASLCLGPDARGRDRHCRMQIWDTAGQECFLSLTRAYYRAAAGVLLVYDVTSRESFLGLSRWAEELRRECPGEVAMVVVGSKTDCSGRQVATEEGAGFAREIGADFLETSAARDTNVTRAFLMVAEAMLALRERQEGVEAEPADDAATPLLPRVDAKGVGCCRVG
jgi:small GTP-binding protein